MLTPADEAGVEAGGDGGCAAGGATAAAAMSSGASGGEWRSGQGGDGWLSIGRVEGSDVQPKRCLSLSIKALAEFQHAPSFGSGTILLSIFPRPLPLLAPAPSVLAVRWQRPPPPHATTKGEAASLRLRLRLPLFLFDGDCTHVARVDFDPD